MGAEVSSLLTPQQSEKLRKKWGDDIQDALLEHARTCFARLNTAGTGYLTRKEFEKGLGLMHADVPFSMHLFSVLDLENHGKVDFYAFLTFILLTSRGSIEDKLYLGYRFLSFMEQNENINDDTSGSLKYMSSSSNYSIVEGLLPPTKKSISNLLTSFELIFREMGLEEPVIRPFTDRLSGLLKVDESGVLDFALYQKMFLSNSKLLDVLGKKIPGKAALIGSERWNFTLSIMLGFQLSLQKLEQDYNGNVPSFSSTSPRSPRMTGSTIGERGNSISSTTLTARDFKKNKFLINLGGGKKAEWNDYAPRVFQFIRYMSGITDEMFLDSLGIRQVFQNLIYGQLTTLSELSSEGKSGSFFYFSYDGKFMVKTINASEKKTLLKILPAYQEYLLNNPNSLLAKFYGVYLYKIDNMNKLRFVVMGNIFADKQIDVRFDLKGSTVGRSVGEELMNKPGVVLKDLDFMKLNRKINIGPRLAPKLQLQVKNDVAFLQQNKIIDYSLLVGVHQTGRNLIAERRNWISSRKELLESMYRSLRAADIDCFDTLDFNQFCFYAYKHSSSGGGSGPPAPLPFFNQTHSLSLSLSASSLASSTTTVTATATGPLSTNSNLSSVISTSSLSSSGGGDSETSPSKATNNKFSSWSNNVDLTRFSSPSPSSSTSSPTTSTSSLSSSLPQQHQQGLLGVRGGGLRGFRTSHPLRGGNDEESNLFRRDHGGMKSHRVDSDEGEVVGEEIIYVGIIDTLITFAEFKQSEHLIRSNMEGKDISVCPPDQYGPRFVKFVSQAIV